MLGIVIFNVVMLGLALGIAAGLVPIGYFAGLLELLHNTIGITTPTTTQQVRVGLLAWIASVVIIMDGMIVLFVYVF